MTSSAPCRGIFGLPPGVAFPAAFVAGFVQRYGHESPEYQARIEIYVNSARMMRAIRAGFDAEGACLMPRLRLIADLGFDSALSLPPPVPKLRRKLQLAQLVDAKIAQDGLLAPGTATFDLADSLVRLLAEMQDEGIDVARLDDPEIARDHAEHWNRSLGFLRIVTDYLDNDREMDAEARQRRIVTALAARWAIVPPEHPVLVVGSTGSRGTTLALMEAVAGLPMGAVVVPGFDFDMPELAWNSLCTGEIRHEDHPQFRLAQFVSRLGMGHSDVRVWADVPPPSIARNRLTSLALRPAPMTDQWIVEGANLTDLRPATDGMSLIEAPNQRAEALAIAVLLREAVEMGQRAALITPDRSLTRRVAVALNRWGIVPDDSGGEPLSQTPPGRLLRQVAGLFGARLTAGPLLGVLKHPLVATGDGGLLRGQHLLNTRDLELRLRKAGPAFLTGADIVAWAAKGGDAGRIAWAAWLAQIVDRVSDRTNMPLGDWVRVLTTVAETLGAGPGQPSPSQTAAGGLWDKAAGRGLRAAVDALQHEAAFGGTYSAHVFQDLLRHHLSADAQRETDMPHPLVAIWGTLEARVQGADLVILGSLNEGAWPEPPAPDPWMSRQMRQRVGLLSPERRIGLSAHDFQQSVAAGRVILTRSRRDAETETVPSRWLARLTNLLEGLPHAGGPDALKAMRDRGRIYLDFARQLEAPRGDTVPAPRPAPRPPVAFRPQQLSVTQIEQLMSDPYAVYARHVLRLRTLNPLIPEADPRLRGEVLHRLVEDFVRSRPDRETLEQAHGRLLAVTDTVLADDVPWPLARRLWRARILRASRRFLSAEMVRAEAGQPVVLEEQGQAVLPDLGFTLTARPDRIDLLRDGDVEIFDYKSGAPPKDAEVKRYRVQLLLEAAMAERGAFGALGRVGVKRATYVQIGGDGDSRTLKLGDGQVGAVWDGLHRLVGFYQNPTAAYVARIMNLEPRFPDDYQGISRFGEWALHDDPVPEDVW